MTDERITEDTKATAEQVPNLEDALQAEQHTLLEIWQSIFSNVDAAEREGIDIVVAGRILAAWPRLEPQALGIYHSMYYQMLQEFKEILDAEIARDPKCFQHTEDDAEKNREHYMRILEDWQLLISEYQHDWTWDSADAVPWMAAVGDAGAFIAGANGGLLAHLDSIGFEFSDEDGMALAQLLEDRKGSEFYIGWREKEAQN